MKIGVFWTAFLLCLMAPAAAEEFDLILRGGDIHDGSGGPSRRGDVAIRGDRIVRVGALEGFTAKRTIDASGLVVAPGFINMLSWATESLLADGNSQGEIRQGVTTEIFGEGFSWGPLTDEMKKYLLEGQGDIRFPIEWTTLSEYLRHLEKKGVSANVASFVGHATLRQYAIGFDDKAPSTEQLELMKKLLKLEMDAGALGLGSALIYAPGSYARTEELIELCKVIAPYRGMYISHLRSEGDRLLESIDELIRISREAGVAAEIYHLKAAGERNWSKLAAAIEKIEAARKAGLKITADMYTYTAGATGLEACIPLWARDGGPAAMRRRFVDPALRPKILREMTVPSDAWENLFLAAGGAENVLLLGFKTDALKPLQGKTLARAAELRGKSPPETILDLMVEDGSRVEAVYFMMSEENLRAQLRLPWVSFCSDAESMAPEGVFLKSLPHPRAYGNFSRLLGKYVREVKALPLEEAIRRLSSLPAQNLGLDRRGLVREGMFADLAVFDPGKIIDRATYDQPHQYATGMMYVVVNGAVVLDRGEHTGARPGRALIRAGKAASAGAASPGRRPAR